MHDMEMKLTSIDFSRSSRKALEARLQTLGNQFIALYIFSILAANIIYLLYNIP